MRAKQGFKHLVSKLEIVLQQCIAACRRDVLRNSKRLVFQGALILMVLQGCTMSDMSNAGQGVYVAPIGSGAPGWIGMPAGIPVWSPDGGRIAWGSEAGLTIAALEGGGTSLLWEHRIAGRPAWSPDGRAIAFVDAAAGSLLIVSTNDGQQLVNLPIAEENARPDSGPVPSFGGPAWSPDGTRLAFACWDGAGDELCVVGADGSERRVVTRLEPSPSAPDQGSSARITALSNAGPPAWSPDGSRLAVAVYPERRGATAGVYVIDLERQTSRRISKHLPNSEIRWMPDGRSLIFSAQTKGRSDVWRVSEETLTTSIVTENLAKGGASPDVSPDGESIALASDGAILILTASRDPQLLAADDLRSAFPAWSPDGREVAFAAMENPIQTYD